LFGNICHYHPDTHVLLKLTNIHEYVDLRTKQIPSQRKRTKQIQQKKHLMGPLGKLSLSCTFYIFVPIERIKYWEKT